MYELYACTEKNLNNSKRYFRANLGAVDNGKGIYEYSNQDQPEMKFQAFNLKDKEYFVRIMQF